MDLDKFCDAWLAAWTGNRPDHLWSYYAANAFYRDPARPEGLKGDAILTYFKRLLHHNPDWIWRRVEVIPTKAGCCLKWRAQIPVDGKIVHESGLDILEFKARKISRNEVYFDRSLLLKGSVVD